MYAILQEQADLAVTSKSSRNVASKEQSAEIAKKKGNQAYKDKQWQKAIGFYTEAIKLCGDNATYYSNRAQAYLEFGSYLQAEADCTKAINLDKKNVKAYFRRGTAREMLGYYKEAIDAENETDKLLLAAKKIRRATGTDFIISLVADDFSRSSNAYVGKLRSNVFTNNSAY